ncbi:MAG: class II fructose-bisphosphate aldolase [Deltaproteobacteria bacterium]|nr:class II fructose-bisphosphate aldolase [Deltaproteobacteria bacterium]
MEYQKLQDIYDSLHGIIEIRNNEARLINEKKLKDELIDSLVYNAVFGRDKEIKGSCRFIIKLCGAASGAKPASIQGLYEAMGRGDVSGFTVPAINIRGLTYDTARAVFRSALKNNVGALIFEIAKSEMDYTDQAPYEYSSVVIASAIKEGFTGPLFIQGDHFQMSAKNYAKDKANEIAGIKELIKCAVGAGFYNIDIDSSTLVELNQPTVVEQQRPNFEIAAELTRYIRDVEPPDVTISVGGEIGEVGGRNSTEEELRVFMDNYNMAIAGMGSPKGISKISIQTGTSHGGVVLPDGTIAKVKVDFDTIERLSKVSREAYGLSGVVQHGASTLPDDAFHIFVERHASEVHLATGFQNMTYDSKYFPQDLKDEIYSYLKEKCAKEKKEGETEEQFIYKTRKKGVGPFKKKMWDLSQPLKSGIGMELEDRFTILFGKLNVKNTKDVVAKWVKPVDVPLSLEKEIENADLKVQAGGLSHSAD